MRVVKGGETYCEECEKMVEDAIRFEVKDEDCPDSVIAIHICMDCLDTAFHQLKGFKKGKKK